MYLNNCKSDRHQHELDPVPLFEFLVLVDDNPSTVRINPYLDMLNLHCCTIDQHQHELELIPSS